MPATGRVQELELKLLKAEEDKSLLLLEISQLKKKHDMETKREQQERKRILREAKVHTGRVCVFFSGSCGSWCWGEVVAVRARCPRWCQWSPCPGCVFVDWV